MPLGSFIQFLGGEKWYCGLCGSLNARSVGGVAVLVLQAIAVSMMQANNNPFILYIAID